MGRYQTLLLLLFGVAIWGLDWTRWWWQKDGMTHAMARKESLAHLRERPSKSKTERANANFKKTAPSWRITRAPMLEHSGKLVLELFLNHHPSAIYSFLLSTIFLRHLSCITFSISYFSFLYLPAIWRSPQPFAKTECNVHYKRNTSCLILLFHPLVLSCDII